MMSRLAPMLVLLAAAACATTPKEPPPKPFAGTRWEAVLEREPTPQRIRPWVVFGDGLMEGFAGCNHIAARYVQDSVGANAIAIGRIETGRRACDASAQNAEARLIEVLQHATSYVIVADAMTMTGSGGSVRFRAVAPEGKP
jgi:heat shock protein HslJ